MLFNTEKKMKLQVDEIVQFLFVELGNTITSQPEE